MRGINYINFYNFFFYRKLKITDYFSPENSIIVVIWRNHPPFLAIFTLKNQKFENLKNYGVRSGENIPQCICTSNSVFISRFAL